MGSRSRSTMEDVARHAGVSLVTVSRVINRPEMVSPSTRDRVSAAITALDFRPDNVARALAGGRRQLIGILTTGIAQHSHSKRMVAFNDVARAAGYEVIIASITIPNQRQMVDALDTMRSQGAAGIVLIAADEEAVRIVRKLDLPIPMVFAESGGVSGPGSIAIDQSGGARLAVRHLGGLGHQRIAHIQGPAWSMDAEQRRRGWEAEVAALDIVPGILVEGDWSAGSGYDAALRILREDPESTAIFVSSDQMALGVLHALHERGLSVPGAMSVVGFDDIPGAEHFIPPLTTVRQDFVQLARELLRVVISELEAGGNEQLSGPLPQLVVRASSGPPTD